MCSKNYTMLGYTLFSERTIPTLVCATRNRDQEQCCLHCYFIECFPLH
jgi:hypothetical protein